MEFKRAKQILNKNRDKKLTDEEIVENSNENLMKKKISKKKI